MHINCSKVTTAYFSSRDNTSYGIHFIDHLGRLVFRLLLTKQEGDFNAEALANFQQNWIQLGEQQALYDTLIAKQPIKEWDCHQQA